MWEHGNIGQFWKGTRIPPGRPSLINSTYDSGDMLHNRTHKVSWHPCNEVVPATCPMKFNKLNFVPHVAGTKYRPNWCCTSKKVSVYTKGHVAAIYPWDMYPQHFHVCANVVILPFHVASVCTTQVFCPDATCPCNMTPRVWPPLSVT